MDGETNLLVIGIVFGPIALLLAYIGLRVWMSGGIQMPRPPSVTESHAGGTFQWTHLAGSRSGPPRVEVSIPAASPGAFHVTREGRHETFFKRIGLSQEVQTGDALFDREVYIDTATPRWTRTFLGRTEHREAIRSLIGERWSAVAHDGKRVIVSGPGPARPEDVDGAVVRAAVPALLVLGHGVTATAVPGQVPGDGELPPAWRLRRAVAFAVPLVVLGLGMAALFLADWPLDQGRLVLVGGLAGVAAALVHAGLAAVLLRGRAASHREWLTVVGMSIAGLGLGGAFLAPAVNSRLDAGPLSTREVRVLGHQVQHGRNRITYWTIVESWRGNPSERVSGRLLQDTSPRGGAVTVETRPGFLGFEWVVSASAPTPRGRAGEAPFSPVGPPPIAASVSPSAEPEAGTAAWHHGRAETHVRTGRHDEALTEVRAALALAPRHFPSLQLIDWLLVGRRRHQEVIALWTGYLAAVPDDGAAYLERGGTYSQIGDRTRALADFARACELGQTGACDILTRAGVRPPR